MSFGLDSHQGSFWGKEARATRVVIPNGNKEEVSRYQRVLMSYLIFISLIFLSIISVFYNIRLRYKECLLHCPVPNPV